MGGVSCVGVCARAHARVVCVLRARQWVGAWVRMHGWVRDGWVHGDVWRVESCRRKGRGNENKQNSMRVLYMSGGLGSEPGRCVDTSSCPRALYVPENPSSADCLTFLLFLPVFFLFSSAFSSGFLLSKEGHRGKKASCERVTTVGPCKIVVNRVGASRNATVTNSNCSGSKEEGQDLAQRNGGGSVLLLFRCHIALIPA